MGIKPVFHSNYYTFIKGIDLIGYKYIIVSLLIILSFCSTATAKKPVLIYYEERTPYAVSIESGGVEGLTASPVAEAFDKAGIPYQWKKMPFKRQLMTIKANKSLGCGIGWFKNSEREGFARFSNPIYQDRPNIVIGKKENISLSNHLTVQDLLFDKNLKLIVKDSFSYGQYIDNLIAKHTPNILVVIGSSNLEMLRLVLSGRGDYFFAAEEEADKVIENTGNKISQFTLHYLSDMPPGSARYLACSQHVPAEMIEQVNKYLK